VVETNAWLKLPSTPKTRLSFPLEARKALGQQAGERLLVVKEGI